MLVVMSDGIFAAHDPAGEMFGVERITEILDRCTQETPANTLACIRDAVKAWQGREEPNDDQSIVIVQRR
jgi:sigma-B regulation protein RsbU (phosphoserine phosphatase)